MTHRRLAQALPNVLQAVNGPTEATMSKSKRFAMLTAATFAVSMFAGASAFADSRHSDETWRARDQGYDRSDRGNNNGNRRYRNNERVTVQGRVQSFSRE